MKRLRKIFDDLNKEYFFGRVYVRNILVVPAYRHKNIYASYNPLSGDIFFSPISIEYGNKFVRCVMHHEMTHCYIHKILNKPIVEEYIHGELFQTIHGRYRVKKKSFHSRAA